MNRMVAALMAQAHSEASLRMRLRVFTALAFVGAALIGSAFAGLYLHLHAMHERTEVERIAADQASLIEGRLSRSLSSTYALAALVRQSGGRMTDFDALATEMLQQYGDIDSLEMAKDGVISQVAPFVGNAILIGHDVLKEAGHNREAILALKTRALTLAGPFEQRQGGQAVVGRLPVFLPSASGADHFWGFAIAVIRVQDLLKRSRLSALVDSGYQYELARANPVTGTDEVFARSGENPLRHPVVRALELPNGRWHLAIAPGDGWVEYRLLVTAAFAVLLFSILSAYSAHTTFKQPLRLRREVAQRTEELAAANRALSDEIAERQHAQDAAVQTSRLYSVLSHTNAAIVRIADRDALLEEICRVAVELGGFPLARIALIDANTGIWHWKAKCSTGNDMPECDDTIHACMSENIRSLRGATPKLCMAGVQDAGRASTVCPQALSAGYQSHVFLQLRVQGRAVGMFSLYAYESGVFDAAQLRLLEEMTHDLSFALENIERETQRKNTEANLRKLSRAVEQSANAVMITDRNGVIEYINPWFSRITGYQPEEILGKTPRVLRSGATHPETHKRMWDTILSGKEWTGELHNTKKNGDTYWCLETISPLKDENGEVSHFVAITEDISERKQTEQTIRHLAFHDPLTGLPNRRLFNDRLHQAAALRHRADNAFALMLLDLDRFKTVNDTLGHDIGDALLKAVAARLLAAMRQGDTLARMGGDEFAVLALAMSHPEEVARLAEKLAEILKEPFHLYGHELYVTTSMGVTLYPGDAGDAEALVRNADIALYRAKDMGRNNFQFFTEDMNASMMQRLRLESAMRWAVERKELMLHYQPQIDGATGRIHGIEALIRWRHPEFGLVSPAQFVPLAEENGMIIEIGEWVLREACAQAKRCEREGVPTRVAVNLSARQFHQGDLADTIAGILEEFDLAPSLLEVELTEGILMADTTQTVAVLERLHRMGVQISIDDFGTGYSSLSYLKRLPIQVLKIDQSFVRDIHNDPDDRAIVMAVIALAHSMKLKVVAEGVETHEQFAFLREYDCDIMQGYLFSRPVPGEEVLRLLRPDAILLA
ncbi:MAG TPA: EAL domain-containing protein [Noviherbaspirillum sp.]|uniref:bifunctional diguanylate cyclase/phosphodiesterase n=1 Tax=Noviherbaspirillum sp. TaxID=1926288 RepID=UPI002B4A5464|nr:EAL domain-containing protein [Noviherbaspirillum sp.]HJV88647.1 EAL domain-containing protein [Noviherbaspirillum sp.]